MEGARGNGKKFVYQREIFKFLEGGFLLGHDGRLAKSRDA
jgi:hypothetical protein